MPDFYGDDADENKKKGDVGAVTSSKQGSKLPDFIKREDLWKQNTTSSTSLVTKSSSNTSEETLDRKSDRIYQTTETYLTAKSESLEERSDRIVKDLATLAKQQNSLKKAVDKIESEITRLETTLIKEKVKYEQALVKLKPEQREEAEKRYLATVEEINEKVKKLEDEIKPLLEKRDLLLGQNKETFDELEKLKLDNRAEKKSINEEGMQLYRDLEKERSKYPVGSKIYLQYTEAMENLIKLLNLVKNHKLGDKYNPNLINNLSEQTKKCLKRAEEMANYLKAILNSHRGSKAQPTAFLFYSTELSTFKVQPITNRPSHQIIENRLILYYRFKSDDEKELKNFFEALGKALYEDKKKKKEIAEPYKHYLELKRKAIQALISSGVPLSSIDISSFIAKLVFISDAVPFVNPVMDFVPTKAKTAAAH